MNDERERDLLVAEEIVGWFRIVPVDRERLLKLYGGYLMVGPGRTHGTTWERTNDRTIPRAKDFWRYMDSSIPRYSTSVVESFAALAEITPEVGPYGHVVRPVPARRQHEFELSVCTASVSDETEDFANVWTCKVRDFVNRLVGAGQAMSAPEAIAVALVELVRYRYRVAGGSPHG